MFPFAAELYSPFRTSRMARKKKKKKKGGGGSLLLFLAPLLLAGLLVLGAWVWLGIYTRHNVKVQVPDVGTMEFEQALETLEAKGLNAEVIDSVYSDEVPKGTVVDQDPHADKNVKPGRTVYLVMNASQPKMLNMPDLVNMSTRQAMSVMEILGLKVKEVRYRPDPCVGCVLEQLYEGKPIKPDTRIRSGEGVTLVLGEGQVGELVPVPDLRGMAYNEMRAVLSMASLNMGLIVEVEGCGNSGCDTALATVLRQFPAAGSNELIRPGMMIDVWLTMDSPAPGP